MSWLLCHVLGLIFEHGTQRNNRDLTSEENEESNDTSTTDNKLTEWSPTCPSPMCATLPIYEHESAKMQRCGQDLDILPTKRRTQPCCYLAFAHGRGVGGSWSNYWRVH
jgi:hypothetical protein